MEPGPRRKAALLPLERQLQ